MGDVMKPTSDETAVKDPISIVRQGIIAAATAAALVGIVPPSANAAPPTPVAATTPSEAWVPNPEYDRVLAEARAAGNSTEEQILDYLRGKYSGKEVRSIRAYMGAMAAIIDETRIAGKREAAIERRNQERGIDEAAITIKEQIAEGRMRADRSKQELDDTAMRYITVVYTSYTAKKSLTPDEIQTLREIYANKLYGDQVKKEIARRFPLIINTPTEVVAKG